MSSIHMKQAATLILLRETATSSIETFIQQRALTMPFAPGQVSFPGGGLELEDGNNFETTARRETFEETGVMLSSQLSITRLGQWITPEAIAVTLGRGYHVHYFMADLTREPYSHELTNGSSESIASHWITPASALEKFAEGEYSMNLPTWWHLNYLAQVNSIEAALTQGKEQHSLIVHDRLEGTSFHKEFTALELLWASKQKKLNL